MLATMFVNKHSGSFSNNMAQFLSQLS